MTDNPFGAGGFDMNALLQQAQQLQEQLQETQERLLETTVEGSVAGGAVTVTLTGAGDIKGIRIAPGTVDGDDPSSLEDLTDLIIAAYRDGKAAAERLAAESLGPLGQGLGGFGDLGLGDLGGGDLGGGDLGRGDLGQDDPGGTPGPGGQLGFTPPPQD